MKKNIHYQSEPMNVRVVKDFLPRAEDLVLKEEKAKVTLSLSKRSVDFFKKVARKQGTAYQAMIRRLLDYYVAQQ
jgi:predicted DNA binding CopG/RHH family protein